LNTRFEKINYLLIAKRTNKKIWFTQNSTLQYDFTILLYVREKYFLKYIIIIIINILTLRYSINIT